MWLLAIASFIISHDSVFLGKLCVTNVTSIQLLPLVVRKVGGDLGSLSGVRSLVIINSANALPLRSVIAPPQTVFLALKSPSRMVGVCCYSDLILYVQLFH